MYFLIRADETARSASETAKRGAKATEDTVAKMDDTARRQLRAYIGIESAVFEQISSATATSILTGSIKMEVKNFGSTPATNLIAKTEFKVGMDSDGKGVIPFSSAAETHAKITVPPGKDFTLLLPAFDEGVSAEKWHRFAKENQVGYFFGRIDYEDAFGEPRFVLFQMKSLFGRMTSLVYCEHGNDSN